MDFETRLYLILSNAWGQLDRLLADTITSIRETAYGTRDMNRYRYEEVPGDD